MPENFGDYTLLKLIATGGMAEIYLSQRKGESDPRKRLVVKRMLPQLAVRKDFVDMFLDEARLAANLVHPNIVQVFNLGEVEGSYFMSMELIDGPHLGALFAHSLRIRRPLPIDLCVHAVARSSDGLHFAHRCKGPNGEPLEIVHRDISPQNILVSRFGDVKVTDFGVAKAANQSRKTRTGIIKGKVSYMSPEQCLGDDVNPQTDVFALGIVLYELLTRRRLFREKSDLLVMQRITTEKLKPPSSLNPAVDKGLDAITMRALNRDLKKRYQSAGDLADALDVWLAKNGHVDGGAKTARWIKAHGENLRASPPSEQSISNPLAHEMSEETSMDHLIDSEATMVRRDETVALESKGSLTGIDSASNYPGIGLGTHLSESDGEGEGTLVINAESLGLTANDNTMMEDREKVPSATAVALPPTSLTQPDARQPAAREPLDHVFPEVGQDSEGVPPTGSWSPQPPPAMVSSTESKGGFPLVALLLPVLLIGLLAGGWFFLKKDDDSDLKGVVVLNQDAGVAPSSVDAAKLAMAKKKDAGPNANSANKKADAGLGKNSADAQALEPATKEGAIIVKVTTVPSNIEVKVGTSPAKRTPFNIELKEGADFFATAFFPGQPPQTKSHKNLSAKNSLVEMKALSTLEVVSEPAGALVRVDGKSMGVTPRSGLMVSPDAQHEITLSRAGFVTSKKRIKGKPGESISVSSKLKTKTEIRKVIKKADYGKLNVSSTVTGRIFVDGSAKGNTPKFGIRLKAGKHKVTIRNDDPAVKFSESITIEVGKEQTKTLRLLQQKKGERWVLKAWK